MRLTVKGSLTVQQAQAAILAELRAAGIDDVDHRALAIVPRGTSWLATLRHTGVRTDEYTAAAVADVGRRLAAGYTLANEGGA
jgi:hypothetical protein